MWPSTLFLCCLFFAFAYGQEPKRQQLGDKMFGLLRKYILMNPDESTIHLEDVDVVRSLKTDHFLSKSLMPSNIPGQKDKCWNNCEKDNVNMKQKLLDDLPAKYWIDESSTQPMKVKKQKQKRKQPKNTKKKAQTKKKRSPKGSRKTRRMISDDDETMKALIKNQKPEKASGKTTRVLPVDGSLNDRSEIQKRRVLSKAEGFLRSLRRVVNGY